MPWKYLHVCFYGFPGPFPPYTFIKSGISMKTFVSDISGNNFPVSERVSGEAVRNSIMELIHKDHPEFDSTKHLALSELNVYREKYVSSYLEKQLGEITDIDSKVLQSINDHSLITDATKDDNDSKASVGARIADKVASFGGSWKFIIIFGSFLVLWIALNAFWLGSKGLDPYPFILLNLLLSCLAALQAPVIMMSQNRQSEKDRERAGNDYMVNLKAEIEVRALHEKIDHLMLYQQQELIEIQKVQIEMLSDLQKELLHKKTSYKKEADND